MGTSGTQAIIGGRKGDERDRTESSIDYLVRVPKCLASSAPERTVPLRGEVRGQGRQEGEPVPECEIQVAATIGTVVASGLSPGFTLLKLPAGTAFVRHRQDSGVLSIDGS